jgi:hypothetical protein
LTHGINIYHDVEEYFATCTWMNDNYGWNIIMDVKIKWMNTTYSQPRIMCQCKL